MKKFRVVRGEPNPHTGKMFAMGWNYDAESAREAVAKDTHDLESANATPVLLRPGKPSPVIAVYELTLIPESDWR